jgi:class 3 adenylate cyclase
LGDLFGRLLDRVAAIGATDGDSPEVRLRKGTLTITSATIATLATGWWLTYLALGRPLSAAIPLSYQVASYIGLAWLSRSHRWERFRDLTIVLVLVLPFLLQWTLGGFVNGSVVMVWAFAAPMGALAFAGTRQAVITFAAFAGLTLVSGLIDPWLAARAEPMPEPARLMFFVLDVVGVAFTTFLVLVYFVRERERALDALDVAHRDLQEEQARSESLLLNILPAAVADRLKRGEQTIADRIDAATVVFVDVVDFTPLAAGLAPPALVALLDRVFSAIDAVASAQGLVKIKTAGDSYMAAAGVPVADPDHAARAAEFALALGPAVEAALADTGRTVRLRIGMHSGPLVAGVIGRRTFAYDVWGATVNVASRMESHGVPGRVQVSAATRELIADRYELEPRGSIEVKGIGAMETWLLVGQTEGSKTAEG